jgi:hypothetical protein
VDIQAEHKIWVDREFPGQERLIPAFGMVEEAGELLHCLLKLQHEQLWGKDPRYPDLRADLVDAIGDCAIYCISWCNASRHDFLSLQRFYGTMPHSSSPLDEAACLIREAVHLTHCPGSTVHAGTYMTILESICITNDVLLDDAIRVTWDKVKQRRRRCE